MQRRDLTTGWTFKQRDLSRTLDAERAAEDGWLPATVPGTAQGDLLAQGRIPDPFYGLNENAVQWVGESDWLYRLRFSWSPDEATEAVGEPVLCFDGLDTIVTVWLNGQQILASDNMFVPHRISVQGKLVAGENELLLAFESPLRVGRAREAELGKREVWNGDASRVYVRKAQYQYGWDWGPCILTIGPWQPIWLETAAARIAEVHTPIHVSDDLRQAQFAAAISIEHPEQSPAASLHLALYGPDGALVDETAIAPLQATVRHTFMVEQPALWWPNGYGEQPRYRLVATLRAGEGDGATVLDEQRQALGVRRLRLLQEPIEGEEGKSFRFEVNNTPIFCGGANWIPADLLPPRVSAEHYRTSLQQAADANMTMIRVWGGGIFESDTFYDLCDELGLLIWQDFLFACGIYPTHDTFMRSVREEAEAAVRRLRHHPCLALWSGNNEDYAIAASLGRPISGPITDAFPARAIYEHLLPDVCAALDPQTPYRPGSPYGDPDTPPYFGQKVGDWHVWNIWHQEQLPYQAYPRNGARFVSEFGMAALPSAQTIARMADPAERYPGSRTLDFHFKADQGVRRVAVYLSENLRIPADLEQYRYATQVVQAEALTAAMRGWRRQFQGPGRYGSSGALIWQLNDCWPCISWAIVDDVLTPKLAYYAVRRALAPLTVGLEGIGSVGVGTAGSTFWAGNSTADEVRATVRIRRWSLAGALAGEEERAVVLAPHQTSALGSTTLTADETHALQAHLLVNGAVRATSSLWAEPLRYLTLADPGITIEQPAPGQLRLAALAPAKSVWLEPPDGAGPAIWSDNGFDLFPGEPLTIAAPGLTGPLPIIHTLYDLQQ